MEKCGFGGEMMRISFSFEGKRTNNPVAWILTGSASEKAPLSRTTFPEAFPTYSRLRPKTTLNLLPHFAAKYFLSTVYKGNFLCRR